MKNTVAIFIVVLILFPLTSVSQVSITATGQAGTYLQDFDGTFLGTGNYSLTNNSTGNLGWYAVRSAANATPNIFDEDTGSGTTGEFNNYGASSVVDRAFGSIASTGTGTLFYGLRIQNDTGVFIRSVRIQFTGEQWRDASTTAQSLAFSYQVSGGDIISLTAGTWTNVAGLDFVTPVNLDTDSALDGNLAGNRVVLDQTIAIDVPVAGEIMLRWSDINDTGDDHGLAIEDVAVTLLVPTVAQVSVSGRVTTASGTGIGNAILVLTGGSLAQPLIARTNPFGYYQIDGIPAGETYLLEISSKRYMFSLSGLVINAQDNVVDANFVSESK